MPVLRCPRCHVRQYAHVSYVVDVCCVECGYRLIAPRAVARAGVPMQTVRTWQEPLAPTTPHAATLWRAT